MRRNAGALALVALTACWGHVRAPQQPRRETSLGLHITSFTAPNGMRVVLVPDPNAGEVQVTMRFSVGSIDDPAGKEGLAHLVEHLMFQQISDGETLLARLEDDASSFNAYTRFEDTVFVARAAPEHLEDLLAIDARRIELGCSTITEDVFRRERQVVVNEIREHEQAAEIESALGRALYPPGHPYDRPIGGSEATVGSMTLEQACELVRTHYSMRNATLVLSGPLDAARLTAAVAPLASLPPGPEVTSRRIAQALGGQRLVKSVPIDEPMLVIAWPLPPDPEIRAQIQALVPILASRIDARVEGSVRLRDWGDDSAPAISFVVTLGPGESSYQAMAGVQLGIQDLPKWLESDVLEATRQIATYELYSSLEDGSDRDQTLARQAAAGRAPETVVERELEAVRGMSLTVARSVAHQRLSFEAATSVLLNPVDAVKRGHAAPVGEPIHDAGQQRLAGDPAEANQPVKTIGADPVRGAITRQLANGMTIVLLPMSSTPSIDIRLVFGSGTADEPADHRGIGYLAAYGLREAKDDFSELLDFYKIGGMYNVAVDVDPDRTRFGVRGLAMHVDYLLIGLERLVRNGRYDELPTTISQLRRDRLEEKSSSALEERWRRAIFGTGHPYVHAGLEFADLSRLDRASAARFRGDHYTPDNATLIVSGGFDAAATLGWIAYLFDDWRGQATARPSAQAVIEPDSIGTIDETSQILLRIALPTGASEAVRPQQRVAAEMLENMVTDVRHQLGATYDLHARLSETRLAIHYVIDGYVDVARAADAIELLAHRVEQLQRGGDDVARAFVAARRRVLSRLESTVSGSSALAGRAETLVELQLPVDDDARLARAVRALTIKDMAQTLGEIDLSRAAIYVRGPKDAIEASFQALGRRATIVTP